MAEQVVKKSYSYLIKVIVGIAIIVVFWTIPPIAPITALGMRVFGVFISMIWLWSTVGALWPSIMGIIMLGIAGMGGDAGFAGVWTQSVGNSNVLLVLFAFILFGAFDLCGNTNYMARWILTRNLFAHRPYAFLIFFFLANWVLSAFAQAIIGLIIMWPITLHICSVLGITKEDRLWKYLFVGMFIFETIAMPFFPFNGAPIGPVSAFAAMSAQMGLNLTIPYVPYMLSDVVVSIVMLVIFMLIMKITRVDVSKLAAIEPKMIDEHLHLPPMNFVNKIYFIVIILWVLLILVPSFLPMNPVVALLKDMGPLGVTAAFTLFMVVFRYQGKPLMNFGEVAAKSFNWDIFFMIAAAIFVANSLSADSTGIMPWLKAVLDPILGNLPEMAFVFVLLLVALVITNFANNAAMAIVLMPIVLQFSVELGMDPTPLAIMVILMVFMAMLTPSASPHAGMMWGQKEIYTPKDILSVGFPMALISVFVYSFIGYPCCKMFIAMMG